MALDREAFLRERRRLAPARMDLLFASDYDAHWGEIGSTHRAWLSRFLQMVPARGVVLDAACGTGIYWPLIRDAGRSVVGMDHSDGMLAKARQKYPDVTVHHERMQDLGTDTELHCRFDGLVCIDAMENVFPEDWPVILAGFATTLRTGAPVYLTVELPGDDVSPPESGLPLVPGEVVWPDDHGGGYHYYPTFDRVERWLADAGITLVSHHSVPGNYLHVLAHT